MCAFHVKKGDEVVVLTGTERGKRGRVVRILPKKERVIVEGARMMKRHTRKDRRNPEGGIIEREGSIHVSNVMLASRFDERAQRRGQATEKTA